MDQQNRIISLLEAQGKQLKAQGKQFEKIDQRFDGMDQRFDRMDERFEKMDQRFDRMDERFEKMDQRFEKIDQRSNGMEETQNSLIQKVIDIDTYMHQELATKTELQEVGGTLLTHIDGLTKHQEKFDHELTALRFRVETIQENFGRAS